MIYDRISPGSREFRILILLPSDDSSSDILCKLSNVSLDAHPEYEALSYVWGDLDKCCSVVVGDETIRVTRNLATILRHLRLADHPRNLWVDALCINQSDTQERSEQVLHMRDIYKHCTTDLLWVESMTKGNMSRIERGLEAMDKIGTITELERNFRISDGEARGHGNRALEIEFMKLKSLFLLPAVWRRVWIMQEVSFAPRVVLIDGHGGRLPWERVDAFLDVDNYITKFGFPDAFHNAFGHYFVLKNELNRLLSRVQILAHQRRLTAKMQQQQQQQQEAESPPASSLLDVLARFRHTDATDPRDMVFALLGLTSNPLSIQPSYDEPVRTVYIKTAAAIIDATRNLDLLCQSPWVVADNRDRDPALPSWVPDFAHPGSEWAVSQHRADILFAQRGIYAASGDEGLRTPCAVADDGSLVVEGWGAGAVVRTLAQSRWGDPIAPGALPRGVLREGVEAGNGSLRQFLDRREEEEGEGDERTRGSGPRPNASAAAGAGADAPSRCERYWRTFSEDCKRYPISRLSEDELRALRPLWEAWLRIPWVVESGQREDGGTWKRISHEGAESLEGDIFDILGRGQTKDVAVLEGGTYAKVPPEAKKGDLVAVLKGAKTPVLLRKVKEQEAEDTESWNLVGACYVHGLMDGEIVRRKGVDMRCYAIA